MQPVIRQGDVVVFARSHEHERADTGSFLVEEVIPPGGKSDAIGTPADFVVLAMARSSSARIRPIELSGEPRSEPVEIAVDPIAAAGIAHAHALLAEHTAAARIFELEIAIERAKAEYQTAKETRLKADRALTDAVTARTIPTAPKET